MPAKRRPAKAKQQPARGQGLESRVKSDPARRLSHLTSLWADLQLVEMVLHYRRGLSKELVDVYLRRALWEEAIIAYARCFTSGRRPQVPSELIDQLSPDEQSIHRAALRWRHKHVAHRVEDMFESVETSLVYRPTETEPRAARIRLTVMIGPDDADLPDRLGQIAKALKDRIWTDHMAPTEIELLDHHRNDPAVRNRAALPPKDATSGDRVTFTINPSYRGAAGAWQ